ncbi:MAG: CapA family protein, partial [Mariniphaga sp.]
QHGEDGRGHPPQPLSPHYIWGDALKVWHENLPESKLINLETSITTHHTPWPGKGINYRMSPENVNVLTAAGIDHCSLANNHIMDWSKEGLLETLNTLQSAGIKFSGAGKNQQQAEEPSVLETSKGRIIIFSYASQNSGVPPRWQAVAGEPGVNLLNDFGADEIHKIKQQIEVLKQGNDIVIFSIHWGPNWGYAIPEKHRQFAHMLIDEAGVDLIYGHSSHHPLGMEVYKDKLIVYGAGDFINDYEGISGHEEFRGELALMYFPELELDSGNLKSLKMVPMEIRKFRLNFASEKDARWLQKKLNKESEKLGAGIGRGAENSLWLEWK